MSIGSETSFVPIPSWCTGFSRPSSVYRILKMVSTPSMLRTGAQGPRSLWLAGLCELGSTLGRRMWRKRLLWSGGILLLIAVGTVAIAFANQVSRARYCEQLLQRIDALVLVPPSETSDLEWAAAVYWTHNLHCNAMPQVYASAAMLRRIDEIVADVEKLPGLTKINLLWDEYSKVSQGGYVYREKYLPIRDEIVREIAVQGSNYSDSRSYNDFLTSIRSRNSAEVQANSGKK